MIIYTNSKFKPKKKRATKGEVAKKYKPPAFKPLETKLFSNRRTTVFDSATSVETNTSLLSVNTQPEYEGEMLERELAAQEEIAAKKKRVAPHFSKGAYQYITDDGIVRDLGKKI